MMMGLTRREMFGIEWGLMRVTVILVTSRV